MIVLAVQPAATGVSSGWDSIVAARGRRGANQASIEGRMSRSPISAARMATHDIQANSRLEGISLLNTLPKPVTSTTVCHAVPTA